MNKFLWAGRKIKLKNVELLKEVAQEANIELEIASGLPHTELQEKIKNCYVVVLPSFSEVCPNFVLEALSMGKPFIMTEETGLREMYDRGGIFINPFDKEALRRAFQEMLDPVKYEQYREETGGLESRSWKQVAEEFISLWQ